MSNRNILAELRARAFEIARTFEEDAQRARLIHEQVLQVITPEEVNVLPESYRERNRKERNPKPVDPRPAPEAKDIEEPPETLNNIANCSPKILDVPPDGMTKEEHKAPDIWELSLIHI